MHAECSQTNVLKHVDLQRQEVIQFVQRISQNPKNFIEDAHRFVFLLLLCALETQLKDVLKTGCVCHSHNRIWLPSQRHER